MEQSSRAEGPVGEGLRNGQKMIQTVYFERPPLSRSPRGQACRLRSKASEESMHIDKNNQNEKELALKKSR